MASVLNTFKRYWFTLLMWSLVVLWWQLWVYVNHATPDPNLARTGYYPLSANIDRPRNIFWLATISFLLLPFLYSFPSLIRRWRKKLESNTLQYWTPFTAVVPVICLLGFAAFLDVRSYQLDFIEDTQRRYYLVLNPNWDEDGYFLVYVCDLNDRNCSTHYASSAMGNNRQEVISRYSGRLGIENERLYVCIYYENAEENTRLIEDVLAVDWNSPTASYDHVTSGNNPLCQRSSSP